MHVRMRKHITGARNGLAWPNVGELIELPDHEAADMIANGYAEEAPHATPAADDVEAAPTVDDHTPDGADDDPAPADDPGPAEADPVKPKRARSAKRD